MGKFINFITNPDWWGVILSAISTIAVIAIAVVQIKLQKREVKQQEYEVYRALYEIVKKINNYADILPGRIYEYFSYPIDRMVYKDFWEFLLQEINALDRQLQERFTDFDLKFGHDMPDAQYYSSSVCDMRLLVQFLERLEDNKQMQYKEDKGKPHPGIIARRGDPTVLIEAIVEKVTYEPYKDAVRTHLSNYFLSKDFVTKQNTLGKIAQRCKID